MEGSELQNFIQFIALERVPYAIVVALIGWALLQGSTRLLDDLGERFTERRLFFKQAKALSRFFLYLAIPTIVASSILRLESQALFAVAGSISVAVGFAFKDLLGSAASGWSRSTTTWSRSRTTSS